MMKKITRTEAADFLRAHNRFAIVTHQRPDGDTLGSAAVLCRGLRQLGKTAHILENPEITERYAPLCAGLTKKEAEPGDAVVCVDVAAPRMLPACFAGLEILLRIDHHETGDSFAQLELVEPDAAATGEVVYGVLQLMGVVLDKPIAEALYTAVSTDTGCFRYANTTANSFAVAADCVNAGVDVFTRNQELFETNSLGRLRLQGHMVENAVFSHGGAAVICAIPLSVERELALMEDDMENISGFPRTISGVKVAATLREIPGGSKLSVRAVPGYDAGKVCATFGGGGHAGAAGANLPCAGDEAIDLVQKAIDKIM